jgi:ribose transport system ATP-binding protein
VRSKAKALEIAGMSMSFGFVQALSDFKMEVRCGEVHGLIGQNGAGKSTVVKVLGGVHTPLAGATVTIHGHDAPLPLTDGAERGLAIVHQELGLCDELEVWENFGATRAFGSRTVGPISRRGEIACLTRLCEKYGYTGLEPRARVSELRSAQRTQVGILRAIREMEGTGSREHILVLDEPTAALPQTEVEKLLRFIRGLAAEGHAVVLVTHYLSEIIAVCDRVTVVREGTNVGTYNIVDVSAPALLDAMLGYHPDDEGTAAEEEVAEDERRTSRDVRCAFSARSVGGSTISDVSFDVAPGEIVGFTGLVGMGAEDLPYLLAGVAPRSSGEIELDGVRLKPGFGAARDAGLGLVPANRARDGLWLDASIQENLTIQSLARIAGRFWLRRAPERRLATRTIDEHGIVSPGVDVRAGVLSGGNQQKVLLSKWLNESPSVLIVHSPTQGVDPSGRREIHGHLRAMARDGMALILVSDDPEELTALSNVVHVLKNGRIEASLPSAGLTEEAIVRSCH